MVENNRLGAAEALVLMSLPRFDARKALKIGFMELLVRGVLRIEQRDRPGLLHHKHSLHITAVPSAAAQVSPVAASLVSVVRTAEPKDGALAEILKRARRQYGRGFSGFVSNVTAPALVECGLVEARRERSLLFRVTRFYRTPVADTEVGRLQQAICAARAIPEYLDRDPAQAVALVTAAGAAILLVDELRQHYQQLAVALQPREGWDLARRQIFSH